ncbi:hypothetical protein EYF80_015629 [Liparis tanakae]|uniref:Uncharacterized protein n=1 Tax=Liparis tanakae TaxID=230148 RepID=A0A4Z2IA45_9TELE|nr:hypothetical protein EYF80_015629 [Liparis tanakae]
MHSSSMPAVARSCCRAASFSVMAAFSASFWDKAWSQQTVSLQEALVEVLLLPGQLLLHLLQLLLAVHTPFLTLSTQLLLSLLLLNCQLRALLFLSHMHTTHS